MMGATTPPTSSRIIISPNQSSGIAPSSNGSGYVMSARQLCGEELFCIPAIAELAQFDQWVAWKRISRNGRQDKVPVNVATNKLASHSDPDTWNSYGAALGVRAQYSGIGFVFSTRDPYTGIDFDGCREPKTGEIAEWAWKWIQKFNSYTEISPSGTGVKVWVRGALPKNIGKDKSQVGHIGIEAYSHSRYFCVTAQHLPNTPETINEAQPILDQLYHTLRPEKPKPALRSTERKATPGEQAAAHLTLAECHAQARAFILGRYDLAETLEAAGAEKTASGYSCPFCSHSHTTTLTVESSGMVGYSHSPRCKLYSEKGFDVTNVLIIKDNYSNFDSLARALAPHCFPKPKLGGQRISPDYLTPAAEQRRNQDRARKRDEAHAAQEHRRALQAAQTARLAADATACDTYQRAWSIHCTYFGSVAQHCVSLARMAAELSGVVVAEERHIRKMQRANKWLIAHGYLVRIERTERRADGKQHTNYWEPAPTDVLRVSQDTVTLETAEHTFSSTVDALRVSDAALPKRIDNATRDTLGNLESGSLEKPDSTCEAEAPPLSCAAPTDLGDWQAYDPPIGAEELNALDCTPLVAPHTSPVSLTIAEGPPTPVVWRSGLRWCAYDGRCYTWHLSESLAHAYITTAAEGSNRSQSSAPTDSSASTAMCSQPAQAVTVMPGASATSEQSLHQEAPAEYRGNSAPVQAERAGASYNPVADWTATATERVADNPRAWNYLLPPKVFYTLMRRPVVEMCLREDAGSVDEPAPVADEDESELLALAPPAEDSLQYSDFSWRWWAAQQKDRSNKQRRLFRSEAENLLVEVPPTEAARRWNAFFKRGSSSTRAAVGTGTRV